MKLTRSQKAVLLKEIANLISYFQTPEKMDVKKFISILAQKYSSWEDVIVDEDSVKTVSILIRNLATTLDEKLFETPEINNDVEVTVTGSDVSTAGEDYLSSELMVWNDEKPVTDSKYEFSFTGFATDNFQDTNAISISPEEFWSDEETESTMENDFLNN